MTQATSLLTDRYELTMLDAALKAGPHDRECVFECFARRLPSGRRFGVVAGTGRLLELIRDFRFRDAELEYLRAERVVGEEALAWLADYRFRGRITGYREGEVYFPGSPLLTVEAPFADGVILETLVLSVLNYDSAVASAAARMVQVAGDRPLAEMGSRRTGERSAVAAARAAFIAGFSATSNLEAGRAWGVPTMGTAAHSFTLLHDTEEQAFRAQVDALGAGTTLLVDTYDVRQGVETAVRVAGPGLGAVRLDSGDLPVLVGEVRAQLDALGAGDAHHGHERPRRARHRRPRRVARGLLRRRDLARDRIRGPGRGHGLQARRPPRRGRRRRLGVRREAVDGQAEPRRPQGGAAPARRAGHRHERARHGRAAPRTAPR